VKEEFKLGENLNEKSQKKKNSACTEFLVITETIVNYVVGDLNKKRGSFQIGVFTIFLVVTFITMLKGVIDAMPVLFLQIAETQTSAIDFTMTPHAASPNGLLTLGNVNFYAMDPWGNFSENLHTSPGAEKSPFGF